MASSQFEFEWRIELFGIFYNTFMYMQVVLIMVLHHQVALSLECPLHHSQMDQM